MHATAAIPKNSVSRKRPSPSPVPSRLHRRKRPRSPNTTPIRVGLPSATATAFFTAVRPPPSIPPTPRLPTLPADIWHYIATLLPPVPLATLSQTSRALHRAASPVQTVRLFRALRGPLHPVPRDVAEQLRFLTRLVLLLDQTPSLRHKALRAQLQALISENPPTHHPASACFTPDQARIFLRVDPAVLQAKFAPAQLRAASTRGRRPVASALAFAAFPPDPRGRERACPTVFALREVLLAAWETHGDLADCFEFVAGAVRDDERRFRRAEIALREVRTVAEEVGVQVREIEYALGACAEVVEFRRGVWKRDVGYYVGKVRELVRVHVRLGGCYRCLLSCDGNARLKAKRIVGKILKRGGGGVEEVVRTLEGNLWWARSRSIVQKMEEMRADMPHIRV